MKILLLVVFLSGCSVQGWEIEMANQQCAEHGKVSYYISSSGDGICMDGTRFEVSQK